MTKISKIISILGISTFFIISCSNDDTSTSGTISGADSDVSSATSASTAATSASSAATTSSGATSSKAIEAATKTAISAQKTTSMSGSFNGTYYCNGDDKLKTTDQGKGSLTVTNSSMSGTYNYATTASSWDYSTSGTATYSSCQMKVSDVVKLKSWDGKSAIPTIPVTLTGTLTLSDTAKGSSTSSTLSLSPFSYNGTGNTSNSGTMKSDGFTVMNTTTGAMLLSNKSIDLTGNNSGNYTISIASGSGSVSGEGKLNISGTVGGNAITINWPYSYSYSYSGGTVPSKPML